MRKVLSIVLALLMVSMMIPSMAFAADDLSATGVPAEALVADYVFKLTITSSSANVTVKVNANVFDLPGDEEVVGKIGYITCAPGVIDVTVKTDIPTEAFTSTIRVEDEDDVLNVPVDIDDRLIGDVSGDNVVNGVDASQILRNAAELSVLATFNSLAGNVSVGDNVVNGVDASQILRNAAELSVMRNDIGKYANGNTADVKVPVTDDFVDPESWETTTEPEAVKLDAVTDIIAMVEGTTVHYEFVGNANASSYVITVNGVAATLDDATAVTGSFEVTDEMNIKADGTDVISVVAVGDQVNYLDSDPAEGDILAAISGTLAAWLEENGLQDVIITVYEIK